MHTNIDIDQQLLGEAQSLSGTKTQKQVVDEGLKLLVQMKRQQKVAAEDLKSAFGNLTWEGDLDAMRLD